MTEQVQIGMRLPEQEVRYIIEEIKLLVRRVHEKKLSESERQTHLKRIASLQRQLQESGVIK
ncbi:MAG TPA: hypothetical protein DIV47_02655 [Candidatus Pacebacteria bacterium]|nr:hypothetical protein [Candidatus Paceibacterota bacterium]